MPSKEYQNYLDRPFSGVGTGWYSWSKEAKTRSTHFPKAYKIVTLEIEGVTFKFRVDPAGIIVWVLEPKGHSKEYYERIVGMSINEFMDGMTTPLVVTSPITHPAGDYSIATGYDMQGFVLPKFPNVSPAAYAYFERLANIIADYMAYAYDQWDAMSVETRELTAEPWIRFAGELLERGPNSEILPLTLAKFFLEYAGDMLTTETNIQLFFKEVASEIYSRGPNVSYEKLYETFHDAQQLTDERMRGTLRSAEIREANDSQVYRTIAGVEQIEPQRQQAVLDLVEAMNEELFARMEDAFENLEINRAQRIQDSISEMSYFFDENTSWDSLNRIITQNPELSTNIRMRADRIAELERAAGNIMGKDSERPGFKEQMRVDLKTAHQIEDTRRMSAAKISKFDREMEQAIRQFEIEGVDPNQVISNVQPTLSDWYLENSANWNYGARIDPGPGFPLPRDKQRVAALYGKRVAAVQPRSPAVKIKGKYFDEKGNLTSTLVGESKRFKIIDPSKAWKRKLSAGIFDVTVKIHDFREYETGACNLATLQYLFRRFGGDENAFKNLKRALETGVDVANEVAFRTMLPTFVAMVDEKTGYFQGMDALRAGRRGVFYEFIPPTEKDIRINKRRPFHATLKMRWARVNVSRSLAFYRDKEGKPAGERLRRFQMMLSSTKAYQAKPTPARKRRHYGFGMGLMKEQRGQQFIIQQYLDRTKRTFLENMDKQQLARSTRNEISALFGDEAGAVVRKAVRAGESVTLALAQHLRAKPGDRINVFMNDAGEIGVTVTKVIDTIIPGKPKKAEPYSPPLPGFKRLATLSVPVLSMTEPMEPVSDSFRQAMRAIGTGGYSGNIFQRLANILWSIDFPLPDWNMEQTNLSQAQIGMVTNWLRTYSEQMDQQLNQEVAIQKSTKTIEDRTVGTAIERIVRDPGMIDSTNKKMAAVFQSVHGRSIDHWYKIIAGWTI